MVPDSASLCCRESRTSLSGSRVLLREDEGVDEGIGVISSRSICMSAQALSAASRSPL